MYVIDALRFFFLFGSDTAHIIILPTPKASTIRYFSNQLFPRLCWMYLICKHLNVHIIGTINLSVKLIPRRTIRRGQYQIELT